MNWQRIKIPTRFMSAHNSSMQMNMLHLLNDAELGRRGLFNRTPFIERGVSLKAEIDRMFATAGRLHPYQVYPSFWLYTDPGRPVKKPVVLSCTWIHEHLAGSLYWLSVFQVCEDEKSRAAHRAWFPYKETIQRDGGLGLRLQPKT